MNSVAVGGALAASEALMLPAPARLSTTKGWLQLEPGRSWPTMRARMSAVPPAENGNDDGHRLGG